jgi:hypothetical protein
MNHRSGSCAYEEMLITYLYDEIGLEAKDAFESHLPSCASCTAELIAFREVRERLGEWKQEVVRTAPAGLISPAIRIGRKRRDAISGIWERFLTPLFRPSLSWTGAAAALSAFVLISVAGYSAWRSNTSSKVQQIIRAERFSSDLGRMSSLLDLPSDSPTAGVLPGRVVAQPEEVISPAALRNEQIADSRKPIAAKSNRYSKGRPHFSVDEEQQLLAELGVANSQQEETIPRLSDLLGEPDNNE